jgi:hypothetical protein
MKSFFSIQRKGENVLIEIELLLGKDGKLDVGPIYVCDREMNPVVLTKEEVETIKSEIAKKSP